MNKTGGRFEGGHTRGLTHLNSDPWPVELKMFAFPMDADLYFQMVVHPLLLEPLIAELHTFPRRRCCHPADSRPVTE